MVDSTFETDMEEHGGQPAPIVAGPIFAQPPRTVVLIKYLFGIPGYFFADEHPLHGTPRRQLVLADAGSCDYEEFSVGLDRYYIRPQFCSHIIGFRRTSLALLHALGARRLLPAEPQGADSVSSPFPVRETGSRENALDRRQCRDYLDRIRVRDLFGPSPAATFRC